MDNFLQVELEKAATAGDEALVAKLIKAGADPDAAAGEIYRGWGFGNIRPLCLLAGHGAGLSMMDKDIRESPYLRMNIYFTPEDFRLMTGAGIRADSLFYCLLRSSFLNSSVAGDRQVYDYLAAVLEAGVDPGQRADSGRTAMHACAVNFRHECVALLAGHGADIDPLTDDGLTPLIIMAQASGGLLNPDIDEPVFTAQKCMEMTKTLLEHGANPNKTGVYGLSAMDWIMPGECMDLLGSYGGIKQPFEAKALHIPENRTHATGLKKSLTSVFKHCGPELSIFETRKGFLKGK